MELSVLSDALYHNIDLILSGDKDFLDAGLEKPLIYSPAMLLDYLESKHHYSNPLLYTQSPRQ